MIRGIQTFFLCFFFFFLFAFAFFSLGLFLRFLLAFFVALVTHIRDLRLGVFVPVSPGTLSQRTF